MPRALRIALTAVAFFVFFAGSMAIGVVLFPLLLPLAGFDRERHRDRCTAAVGWGYGAFLRLLRVAGLIDHGPALRPPPELDGRAYVLVANHPSLIDVLFLLHWFRPRLTSLVKSSWYTSAAFGPLLRATHYLPGPGPEDDAAGDEGSHPVVRRMTEHLRAGHPLVVFPEGTRSPPRGLHRFKRGAFEAAVAAGAPVVRVVIRVDTPILKKGDPIWKVPRHRARYAFELLPTLETAGRTGRALRNELQADYERRLLGPFPEPAPEAGAAVPAPSPRG